MCVCRITITYIITDLTLSFTPFTRSSPFMYRLIGVSRTCYYLCVCVFCSCLVPFIGFLLLHFTFNNAISSAFRLRAHIYIYIYTRTHANTQFYLGPVSPNVYSFQMKLWTIYLLHTWKVFLNPAPSVCFCLKRDFLASHLLFSLPHYTILFKRTNNYSYGCVCVRYVSIWWMYGTAMARNDRMCNKKRGENQMKRIAPLSECPEKMMPA